MMLHDINKNDVEMRQYEIGSHFSTNEFYLLGPDMCEKGKMGQKFFTDLRTRDPLFLRSSLPEIIYVHDTGGLGETAVVNFNAGQEVESMWGTSVSVMF